MEINAVLLNVTEAFQQINSGDMKPFLGCTKLCRVTHSCRLKALV